MCRFKKNIYIKKRGKVKTCVVGLKWISLFKKIIFCHKAFHFSILINQWLSNICLREFLMTIYRFKRMKFVIRDGFFFYLLISADFSRCGIIRMFFGSLCCLTFNHFSNSLLRVVLFVWYMLLYLVLDSSICFCIFKSFDIKHHWRDFNRRNNSVERTSIHVWKDV